MGDFYREKGAETSKGQIVPGKGTFLWLTTGNYEVNYLISADQEILYRLAEITFLGETKLAIRLGIKS